jgi:PAS domain S-box-containing protein
MPIIPRFQKSTPVRLWLLSMLASVALTEIIVSGMEQFLRGEVTRDYLVTGFVASLCVAAAVAAILTMFLARLRVEAQRYKAVSEALARSEEHCRLAIMGSNSALWDYDLTTGCVSLSDSWLPFLGGEQKPTVTTIQELTELVPEAERKAVKAAMVAAVKGQNSSIYRAVHRVRKLDGGYIWVLSEGRVTERDGNGRALRMTGINRDITDLKAAEEQMNLAALVYKAIGEAVMVADADNRIIAVNPAFTSMTGYSPEEAIGRPTTLLKSGRHAAAFYHEMWNALNTTGQWQGEILNRRKNGEIYPEWLMISTVYDANDAVLCRVAIFSDITWRKRAEQYHRESAERLQAHMEHSPMAVVLWDKDFHVTQWAGEAERLFGLSAADTLGKSVVDLHVIHDEDLPLLQQTLANLSAGESRHSISAIRNITRDGRVIHCIWYNSVLSNEDGTMASVMSQILDVTRQHQAERALKESEQRFRTLAAATFEGIAITEQGKFVDVNEQLTRMTGYERHELIGQPVMNLVVPADRERVMANILAERESNIEHGMLRKDGSRVIVEARGQIIAQNGHHIRLTAIRDVTARRKAEEELRAAKAEAEQANNAKSRFLAAASHDLRQPLTALKLYVSMLKDKVRPQDRTLPAAMEECVAGLNDLLSKLLDLSKLEAGAVTPQVSDFALDDLLNRVLAAYTPEAESKGLSLRCGRFGLTARTDPVLLQRVLANFVSNAIRYTERGGVLIICRRHHGKRWVEVWDTGIGIPADKTGEIFEEFRQLGGPGRTHGSGLGLAIVARTAGLLGLEIRVQSRPNRGSMFAIELPLGAGKRTSIHPTAGKSRITGLRIAVAEDDSIVLNALVYAMKSAGHEVVAATAGKDLLARLGSRPPDVMVCDHRLAGEETAFDVITLVRKAFGSDLPAIILTGDTDPGLMRSVAGKRIVIQHKPVEFEDLQARIEEAMKKTFVTEG